MSISSKLQKIKESKSYSIPAKRLKEHLKPLLSKSGELEKRWMWELIQNATDLGDDISVKIRIDNNRLSFTHNGEPFTLNEAYNLIMPDSGKDEEHENNKSVIGQFGTGFISTHILSRTITVKGVTHDEEDNDYYEFKFTLDRSERTDKEGLIKSIKSAEDDFQENLDEIENYEFNNEFETVFSYDLTQNYEGIDSKSVLEKGLDYFFNLIPFVFCFRPELSSVKLFDYRKSRDRWTFKKEELDTDIEDLNLLKVIALKNGSKEWETLIGSILEKETAISFKLNHLQDEQYEIQSYPEKCSKLFCAFPMIGSEDFNYPVIIESRSFIPNEARDGIELTRHDLENRNRILEAKIAYERLLEIIEDYSWTKAYNVCSISNQEFKDLETNSWYGKSIKKPIKSEIKSKKLIDSIDLEGKDIRVKLEDCYIPYADKRLKNSEQIIKSIFELASSVIPERLPKEEDFMNWNNAIDFELFDSEKFTIETLINTISNEVKSIADFHSEYKKSEEETITWINDLVSFLINQENNDLLDSYEIIPSQSGDFSKLSKLKIDRIYHKYIVEGFEEKLKDVYLDISGDDYREKLIHEDVKKKKTIKDEDEKVSLKDFCLIVDTKFREYDGDRQDTDFLSSLKEMFNWYTNCGLSDDTLSEYFPWFSKNKSQLYMDTQSPTQREQTFDIILSGKTEALAKIAKSDLSLEELNTLANNSTLVTSFLDWLNQKVEDNPDEELGDIGEEFVYYELCRRFGKDYVEWINEDEYDFRVVNRDRTVRYYIDAKTTNKGIGNSDNVPFYMRYSQWIFLPKDEVMGKYLIARVFKNEGNFKVRFLNIKPEKLN